MNWFNWLNPIRWHRAGLYIKVSASKWKIRFKLKQTVLPDLLFIHGCSDLYRNEVQNIKHCNMFLCKISGNSEFIIKSRKMETRKLPVWFTVQVTLPWQRRECWPNSAWLKWTIRKSGCGEFKCSQNDLKSACVFYIGRVGFFQKVLPTLNIASAEGERIGTGIVNCEIHEAPYKNRSGLNSFERKKRCNRC